MNDQEMPNLDILRSIAVLAVLIDHLVPTLIAHVAYQNHTVVALTANIGQTGVLAFFVHTSLVLMYSLERSSKRHDFVSLRFYIRRIFRIYPLSIAVIVLAVLLDLPSNTWRESDQISGSVILANLLLVQNVFTGRNVLAPLWSLPYEVQMYVFLPLLYLVARLRRSSIYVGILIVISVVLGISIEKTTGHLNMAAYVPCFLAGVLSYTLREKLRPMLPASAWPCFLGVLVLGYCLATRNSPEPVYWGAWVFCLILGVSISLFQESKVRPINWAAKRIARYSYGLYLLHVPVLYFIFNVLNVRSAALGTVLFFPLTLLASMATFHLIEGPLIEVGRKLSERKYRPDVSVQPIVPLLRADD